MLNLNLNLGSLNYSTQVIIGENERVLIEFPLRLKKGQSVASRKSILFGFLRTHFLFLKALLNLKVWDRSIY